MWPHRSHFSPAASLGAAILLAACQAKTETAQRADRPVQVQSVRYEEQDGTREFVGVVRARHESGLGFRVGGKILTRLANVGDSVHAGQVLAQLDSDDLGLQVETARAELTAAQVNLDQAVADFDRYAVLKARGFASAADYDRKSAAKGEAEGRRARAARALELSRKQISYADLVAVADGVITETAAEPGQIVPVGQPVMKLAHGGEKEALVFVPENGLHDIDNSRATITLWSEKGAAHAARLRELSPQADPTTRTYAARFSFLDRGEAAALGMTASVTLHVRNETRAAKLPLSAILNQGKGASVYVVDPAGALRLRSVDISAFTESSAIVTGGVADGEMVVTLGVHKLEPGMRVRSSKGM